MGLAKITGGGGGAEITRIAARAAQPLPRREFSSAPAIRPPPSHASAVRSHSTGAPPHAPSALRQL